MALNIGDIEKNSFEITQEIKLFIDKNNQSIFEDGFDSNFKDLKGKEIKINYTNYPVWFRFEFQNSSKDIVKKILRFNTTISGLIKVFRLSNGKDVNFLGNTGSAVPFSQRLIKATTLGVPIEINPGEKVIYYFKRTSHHRFDARVYLEEIDYVYKTEEDRKRIVVFYVGAIFSLIISNIFLFLYTRERIYFLYSVFVTALPLLILCLNGYLDYFFIHLNPPPSENLFVFSTLATVSAIIFSRNFYQIEKYSNKLPKVFNYLIGALLVNLAFYLSPIHGVFGAYLGIVVDLLIITSLFLLLAGGVVALKRGNAMAKFYLISWFFIFSAAFVFFGMYYGIFPTNLFTSFALLWGNILEMLTVSLGLGYKISILDKEKKEAEFKAKGKEQYQKLVRVLLHDVGNPLSLLHHYINIKNKSPEKFRQDEEKIWPKLTFATRSIYDILDVVKKQELAISDSHAGVELQKVNLNHTIEESLYLFEEKIKNKNLNLSFEVQRDYLVLAEKVSLQNDVINNVLSNAVKFTPEGGKLIIVITEELEEIILKIIDNGIGIPISYREAFERDRKIPSRKGTYGERGTGFGLQLIDSYMKYFKGRMEIQSHTLDESPNYHGTTVKLIFRKAQI